VIRPLLLLLTIVGACFLTMKFSAHHAPGKTPFETLYFHLVPAPLVGPVKDAGHGDTTGHGDAGEHGAADAHGEHGEPLVQIPLGATLGAAFGHPMAPGHLVLFNLQIFQLAAILLILIAFSGVPAYLQTGQGDSVTRVLAGFCHYLRDEVVLPNIGKEHGEKLLPMFLSLFFFILFMNLAGLVPGSVTATASVFVTAGLAVVTLTMMIGGGMVVQGPLAYWRNLVPHVPTWLWPLLFVIEVIGVMVKPFALTVRLFANMTGGHMVVLSFMGLIFFFAQSFGDSIGYASAPVAVGFAVFIMIIEGFVAFVQAYVFTILSVIFVGGSLHPEH
jgi:F-type H+-transporting ATPase subunit a